MSVEPNGPCINDLLSDLIPGFPRILPDGAHFRTLYGSFAFFGNEHAQYTHNADPAASSQIGFTGCKWSWKDDGGIERVMLTFRFAANGTDGEVALFLWNEARYQWALAQGTAAWTAKANDYAMQQILLINPGACECDVLLKALAGGAGGSGGSNDPASIGEGDCELRVQGDFNMVVYNKNGAPNDPSKWTALFNLFALQAWQSSTDDRLAKIEAALMAHGIYA